MKSFFFVLYNFTVKIRSKWCSPFLINWRKSFQTFPTFSCSWWCGSNFSPYLSKRWSSFSTARNVMYIIIWFLFICSLFIASFDYFKKVRFGWSGCNSWSCDNWKAFGSLFLKMLLWHWIRQKGSVHKARHVKGKRRSWINMLQ